MHLLVSLQTSICLQYSPREIAVACLYKTFFVLKIKLPKRNGNYWWETFPVSSTDWWHSCCITHDRILGAKYASQNQAVCS